MGACTVWNEKSSGTLLNIIPIIRTAVKDADHFGHFYMTYLEYLWCYNHLSYKCRNIIM